jgi:Ni,Fe-hydrogenase III small subunit/ferredoxin
MSWPSLGAAEFSAELAASCPTAAISASSQGELRIDYGRCIGCGICARHRPEEIAMLRRCDVASTARAGLIAPELLGPAPGPLARFRGSLHLLHFDAGSDGGEESELQQLVSPAYDLHRLGIFFTPSPRHADVLLVTGSPTAALSPGLLEVYAAMPAPKWVVAYGTDAVSGGLWSERGVDAYLPVDLYVPGSPPSPLALLRSLLLWLGKEVVDT